MLGDARGDMEQELELKRVLWDCRRGMLELDVLLAPYAQAKYPVMDADQRQDFQRLLACNDQELFLWLLRREIPVETRLAELVQDVVAFAQCQD